MKLVELLRDLSNRPDRPFLLIGGHAVNLWGYSRQTHDVDLLIPRRQIAEWKTELQTMGYVLVCEEGTFLQFDGNGVTAIWPLDLMLVSEDTFSKLYARSTEMVIGSAAVRVPSVAHLIALKLHVLKQDLPHRTIKDFSDIQGLVECNGVDLKSVEMKEIFERYGTDDLYRRLKIACEPSTGQ